MLMTCYTSVRYGHATLEEYEVSVMLNSGDRTDGEQVLWPHFSKVSILVLTFCLRIH